MSAMANDGRAPRLCLVDMNGGESNRGARNLRELFARFVDGVAAHNPGLACAVVEVAPRRDGAPPIPLDCDLYVCSGGPGSPLAIDDAPWGPGFRALLAHVRAARGAGGGPRLLAICYSFELVVHALGLGRVDPRAAPLRGVWPVASTGEGAAHPLLAPLASPFAALDARAWQAQHVDGATVLARTVPPPGEAAAVAAIELEGVIEAVQFHPEAVPDEVLDWLRAPETARALADAYGVPAYRRMCALASDGLGATHAHVVPGWLRRGFDALAAARGWVAFGPQGAS